MSDEKGPRGGGGGSRRFAPRFVVRGPVVLTKMCVQAVMEDTPPPLGPRGPESMLFGYNDVQGGFAGSGSVRRPRQGRDNITGKHHEVPPASPAPLVKAYGRASSAVGTGKGTDHAALVREPAIKRVFLIDVGVAVGAGGT